MTGSQTIIAEIGASIGVLDDGTITEAQIKERLLEQANQKAAEAFPDGYTLAELEPFEAWIRGPEGLNMEVTEQKEGWLRFRLYCQVRPK